MRLLLIEDDEMIAETIAAALRREGYTVDCTDGNRFSRRSLDNDAYDLLLIDASVRKEVLQDPISRYRGTNGAVPAIILTAVDEDRASAPDAEADAFLVKPFELDELVARVRSRLFSSSTSRLSIWRHGELELNVVTQEVRKAGVTVDVTPLEFKLLEVLLEAPTRVFRRDELNGKLLEWGVEASSSVVELLVNNARSKIGAEQIVTVRGVGYRLRRLHDKRRYGDLF